MRSSGHDPGVTTKDENEPRVGQDGILSHSYFRNRMRSRGTTPKEPLRGKSHEK